MMHDAVEVMLKVIHCFNLRLMPLIELYFDIVQLLNLPVFVTSFVTFFIEVSFNSVLLSC